MELWLILVVRVLGSLITPIPDCDEVFNYWEPIHFLVYGKGQQTWEYSPEYALRSYLYILIHSLPAYLLKLAGIHGVAAFYILRAIWGLWGGFCQYYMGKSLGAEKSGFFVVISTGLILASHTLLPSTFCMNFLCLALGCFARYRENKSGKQLFLALLSCSMGLIVGWPFAGVVMVMFVLPYIVRYPRILIDIKLYFLGIFSLLLTIVPSILIDTYFYSKPTAGFYNLMIYNSSLSSNMAGSSILYGVEPWYFYLLNLTLNFNIVTYIQIFFLFLLSPLTYILLYLRKTYIKRYRLNIAIMLASFSWLIFMSYLPHKEERFMYTIYPFICYLAAETYNSLFIHRKLLKTGIMIGVVLLSASRTIQICRGYSTPLQVWSTEMSGDVCVGKEWYRFPSSFFIENAELRYYEDGFNGLLPKAFNSTDIIPTGMNNQNREEKERYVDLSSCDYVVDVDLPSTPLRQELRNWTIVAKSEFLDAQSMKQPMRSLYIPGAKGYVWGDYLALKNPKKASN